MPTAIHGNRHPGVWVESPVAQDRPGGRLGIPVGDRFFTQQLILIEKRDDGALTTPQVLPVRCVPLVRAE